MIRQSSSGSMPPAVLLYALASHAQDCVGEKLAQDFLDKLHLDAIAASEKAVRGLMESRTPVPSCGMTVIDMGGGEDHWREATDLVHYHPGAVLLGTPQQPREYRAYQDKADPNHIVLASETPEKEMHVVEKNFSSNRWVSNPESFRGDFSPLDPAEAEDALVKFFGYERSNVVDGGPAPCQERERDREVRFAGPLPSAESPDEKSAINRLG